jgi:phosphoesterase RecJ-like protein
MSADGDGLGSEVAFYHALKSKGFAPQLIHNDSPPERYSFLIENIQIQNAHEIMSASFNSNDICIIFDTHDRKLCEPLFTKLKDRGTSIIFIDHHISSSKRYPDCHYFINETASCTGELTYEILRDLNIEMTSSIANALYTSLIFDTQNFRNMKSPAKTLELAHKLIIAGANHTDTYSRLFDNWTRDKFKYLSKLINQVEYKTDEIGIISIFKPDLIEFNLSSDDVSDLVDLFMNQKKIKTCIVIREDDLNSYKLSFRSRKHEVLTWAQKFGGGGHLYSSGAWVVDNRNNIIHKLDQMISEKY